MSTDSTNRFTCKGCGMTVFCDPDPSHYEAGHMREQVDQKRCTACYRQQTTARTPT